MQASGAQLKCASATGAAQWHLTRPWGDSEAPSLGDFAKFTWFLSSISSCRRSQDSNNSSSSRKGTDWQLRFKTRPESRSWDTLPFEHSHSDQRCHHWSINFTQESSRLLENRTKRANDLSAQELSKKIGSACMYLRWLTSFCCLEMRMKPLLSIT